MRIVSWNCCGKAVNTRLEELALLQADIVCLQECRGDSPQERLRHRTLAGSVVSSQRTPNKGIAIWVKDDYSIAQATTRLSVPHHVSATITKYGSFNAIGVWTHKEPTYPKCLKTVLEAYPDISQTPTVVLGDFNSHPQFDKNNRSYTHNDLVADLNALGLVSAYHHFHRCEAGDESHPTYFHQRKQHQPFHLDYCFIPQAWAHNIESVTIPGFEEFATSDHRPLIVDLA